MEDAASLRSVLRLGRHVRAERKFVEEHGGRIGDIAVYGQESNSTTRRLAMMNLAIRTGYEKTLLTILHSLRGLASRDVMGHCLAVVGS